MAGISQKWRNCVPLASIWVYPRLLMGLLFCLVYVCFACFRTVCFVFELYVACPMDCPFLIPRFLIGSVMLNFLVFCFVFVFELYVACPMDCPFLIPRFLIGSVMANLLVFCFVLCICVCLRTVCCVPNGLPILDPQVFDRVSDA
jgi:hypothetical protein